MDYDVVETTGRCAATEITESHTWSSSAWLIEGKSGRDRQPRHQHSAPGYLSAVTSFGADQQDIRCSGL